MNRTGARWTHPLTPKLAALLALVTSLASAQESHLVALQGTVSNGITKEPIRKAQVSLESTDPGHTTALVATTDDIGQFLFADIKPGRYKLTAEKPSFLQGSYGATDPDKDGSLLKVGPDDLKDLAIFLYPGGAISGQVLDSDGDPLPAYDVHLWNRSRAKGKISLIRLDDTTTTFKGEYRFQGLSPGDYIVGGDPGLMGFAVKEIPVNALGKITKVHDLPTYYPASVSLTDAQTIHLSQGQELAAIDIQIQRGFLMSVSGKVAGLSGSTSKYSLSTVAEQGMGGSSQRAGILPTGEFSISDLPPGEHRLMLMEQGPNGVQMIGETDVTLMQQDLTGVVITPFRPAQVKVRVVMEGEEDKPLTVGSVWFKSLNDDGMRNYLQWQPLGGIYAMPATPPGRYRIGFNNLPNMYLKSVQSGNRTLDPDSIEIPEGANLELTIVYSRNGATLAGEVELEPNQSSQSVNVLLLQDGRSRSPQLDQSLHFQMSNLRPGKYLAVAVEDADPDLWSNPTFIDLVKSSGVETELHEKQTASVHLKLITKQTTDEIKRRLGL